MPLEYDFENSIGFWLITGAQAYQRAVNDELAPQGITYRQCQVLGFLSLLGPISQAELAQKMEVEPPTLVGILDRMERDGWIRREACTDDKRRKFVHPTKNAEPIWSKITAAAKRVRARAMKGLSSTQISQLNEMLLLVRANLEVPAATENS
jgi:MarR family transcriptional regulator for hemolysin